MESNGQEKGEDKKKKKEDKKKKKKKDEGKSHKSSKEQKKEVSEKEKIAADANKSIRGGSSMVAAVPIVRCDAAAAEDARRWLQATLARAGDRGVTASVLIALWSRERGRCCRKICSRTNQFPILTVSRRRVPTVACLYRPNLRVPVKACRAKARGDGSALDLSFNVIQL